MEKAFTFNKWFVTFCALLVVTWGGLKLVSDMAVCEEANYLARSIFSWEWPDLKAQSQVDSVHTRVIQRSANDAIVEVSGKQHIATDGNTTSGDFLAHLSFYKQQNKWILGKVELK